MTDTATTSAPVGLPPREAWSEAARRRRELYAVTPGAPLMQREFGYYCLDAWVGQGLELPPEGPGRQAFLAEEFGYEPDGGHGLSGLGWCEAAFCPAFETRVLEDRGEYEVVQDHAGRKVLCFKGRRNGFMPEYLDHPVKDLATWERDVAWRLAVDAPGRWDGVDERLDAAAAAAARGEMIVQRVAGGYMYLRSLIGPEGLLYAFYDDPALIHACMRAWLELGDAVCARHQQRVTFDEIFFGEDICYNHGPLIGPEMMREFLFPYYTALIDRVKARQRDRTRHLFVHLDTDGDAVSVIDVYGDAIGMDVMSPFEVASGCDVVEIGRRWPRLVMKGGIDKRVLATTPARIDAMLERILPAMRARGGYLPMCDHGVPAEVSLENYRHYRRRAIELGKG